MFVGLPGPGFARAQALTGTHCTTVAGSQRTTAQRVQLKADRVAIIIVFVGGCCQRRITNREGGILEGTREFRHRRQCWCERVDAW